MLRSNLLATFIHVLSFVDPLNIIEHLTEIDPIASENVYNCLFLVFNKDIFAIPIEVFYLSNLIFFLAFKIETLTSTTVSPLST